MTQQQGAFRPVAYLSIRVSDYFFALAVPFALFSSLNKVLRNKTTLRHCRRNRSLRKPMIASRSLVPRPL